MASCLEVKRQSLTRGRCTGLLAVAGFGLEIGNDRPLAGSGDAEALTGAVVAGIAVRANNRGATTGIADATQPA